MFTGGVGAGAFTVFGINGGLAGLGIAAAGGFISGALLSGNIQGDLIGTFSAFVFTGLGQQIAAVSSGLGSGFLGSGLNFSQFLESTAVGGLLGGMLSKIQGGKFGHAFTSAGISNVLGPTLGRIKNDIVRTAANAVLGGTVSELTGGKFGNGASYCQIWCLAS